QCMKLRGTPRITQYGAQRVARPLHDAKRAGEFLGDEHKALVGRAGIDLLDKAAVPELRDRIADVKDHALARRETGLDVVALPLRVRNFHKLADAAEGGSLASLGGRAGHDYEQLCPVLVALHLVMGRDADGVPECR